VAACRAGIASVTKLAGPVSDPIVHDTIEFVADALGAWSVVARAKA